MSTAAAAGGPDLLKIQRAAVVIGVAGLALCGLGVLLAREQFFRSYLVAYSFWLSVGVGSMAVLMLQHLTGGGWGLVLRRLLEGGSRTLPLLALLFVPLLFGVPSLYEWARPEAADDPVLVAKAPYLNVPMFLVRAGVYFVVWLGLAFLLNRWSQEEDRTGDPGLPRRFRLLSAPGLGLFGLTITFASVDWAMSLTPHWYSTMYGVLFGFGQFLTGFTFAVIGVILLAQAGPLREALPRPRLRDLGNLLLAFVMVWAYLSLSQFLLQWSANLREEVPWYTVRTQGGWQYVGLALVLGHFVLPFLILLSGDVKEDGRRLLAVAGLVLLMRLVDLFWLMAPSWQETPVPHWLDLASLAGLGGVWLAFFLWQLGRLPLLPAHDFRRMEAEYGHH